MKIVTYNIRYGFGLDGRYDLKRIADAVGDADIIALQEVERFWRRSGMVDQAEALGNLLPEYYWCYRPSFDVDASERGKDKRVINRRRQFGTMLLSKWPILSSRISVLPQLGTVTMFNMVTGSLECIVDSPIGPLQCYSLHLSSISSRERLLQIDALLTSHQQIRLAGGVWREAVDFADPTEADYYKACDWSNGETPPPAPAYTLFMGDFNSTEESAEYVRFVGDADPLFGRGMHSGDLVDSWQVAKNKIGEVDTWWPDPVERAPCHPLRLDYCFISSELSAKVAKAWVDVDAQGSDHRPYWIELED